MNTQKEPNYVIAFDFEAAGGVPSMHGFTQLGAVLINVDDAKVVAEFNEYASMNGYTWEKRCLDDFWLKNPDRYHETIENTNNAEKSPHEVVNSFLDWIKEYTADMKNVHLITDNAAFDAGILRCFSSVDILYIFGDYRDIIDVSNIYYGIGREPITVDLLDKSSKKCALAGLGDRFKIPDLGVKKDHHPVNDAKVIGLTWAHFQKFIKEYNLSVVEQAI
jgi:hypothetical protein